jgi:hypothetical protein
MIPLEASWSISSWKEHTQRLSIHADKASDQFIERLIFSEDFTYTTRNKVHHLSLTGCSNLIQGLLAMTLVARPPFLISSLQKLEIRTIGKRSLPYVRDMLRSTSWLKSLVFGWHSDVTNLHIGERYLSLSMLKARLIRFLSRCPSIQRSQIGQPGRF